MTRSIAGNSTSCVDRPLLTMRSASGTEKTKPGSSGCADIMMSTPRERVRQAWYGPYSGFVIAGLCGGLVWFFPDAGMAQTLFNLAVLTYVTAAMNLIPFLELDGYWICMDVFQTTGLRQRSLGFLRRELPRKVRTRTRLTRFDWVLLGFGVIGAIFTVVALLRGRYTVRAEISGFKTLDRRGLVLDPGQVLDLGEIRLAVGALTETVEVVAVTRDGYLFVWDTPARTSALREWPSFRHDARNTGRWRPSR